MLPIVHSILRSWKDPSEAANCSKCPHALVISPTRELAMQITSVTKELCNVFRKEARIEIVSIVGGMAEQKQVPSCILAIS